MPENLPEPVRGRQVSTDCGVDELAVMCRVCDNSGRREIPFFQLGKRPLLIHEHLAVRDVDGTWDVVIHEILVVSHINEQRLQSEGSGTRGPLDYQLGSQKGDF